MDDLIGEFITETVESLSVLDQELISLEQNPENAAILGNIFRIVHTIKGTCGFLGLPRLEHIAHASENVLGKIRDKKLDATPQAISLILESLDKIKGLIDYLSANGKEQEGDDTDLTTRLNYYADHGKLEGGDAAPMEKAPAEAAPAFPHFRGDDDLAALEAAAAAAPATPKPVAELVDIKPAAPVAVAAPVAPKAEAKEASGDQKEGAGATQSIRVNIDVLENLMQMVSELVLTRNQLMQIVRTRDDKEFLTPLQQLSHITTELQEGVMKTRMQPIGNAWSKFPRLIRDLSMELGKKIELRMLGAETELDRQLLEVIKDPLTHMVRNSCDHGLETPADRKANGKGETGTVTLSAFHEGGHIIIEIIDDGRGINIERVKQKAIANGLATEASLEAMSEKQIAQFVFHAGFSTAEKVTSVSGRGVGMDVVKTNIQKIGGAIELDSTWGKGSKIAIKIPLTLAIVSVLIVEASGQKFAIPQLNVVEMVRTMPGSGLELEMINSALVLRLRDKLLPLTVLSEVLDIPADRTAMMQKEMFIAVCKVGNYDFGVVIDRVYDTEEIVVKPVAEILKGIPLYSGNTILGDGSVIMILDPNGLARALGSVELGSGGTHAEAAAKEAEGIDDKKLLSFLLFGLGKGAPKAVPLELVSRLEEIDVKDIECADDYPVVQYRGELMRLITLGDAFSIPDSGNVDVVVFTYDKKVIGLVVGEIVDIVHAPFDIKLSSEEAKQHGYLGSMVIAGKTTDVVDVGYLLADLVDEAVHEHAFVNKDKIKSNRLLFLEDSPFFRNLTVPFLTAAGYKVTSVESGQEGIAELSKGGKYDIIVTDIEMPGMDGFEFTQACRSNPQYASIPIVAYTSSLSEDIIKKGKSVGMYDCINKTDRPGLLESLSHCLTESREVAA